MSYADLLNSTCTIQKCTYTESSVNGEQTESWANYATSVPCRLNVFSGGRRDKADDVPYITVHKLFLAYRTDMNWKEYRIVIGSETYGIQSVEDAGGAGNHIEIVIELVK